MIFASRKMTARANVSSAYTVAAVPTLYCEVDGFSLAMNADAQGDGRGQ